MKREHLISAGAIGGILLGLAGGLSYFFAYPFWFTLALVIVLFAGVTAVVGGLVWYFILRHQQR